MESMRHQMKLKNCRQGLVTRITKKMASPLKSFQVGIIILGYFIGGGSSYKPIFIVHGILSQNITMVNLSKKIEEYHPGTKIYISSRYCGWDSLIPLMHQAEEVGADLLQISALHPEGFHLIGYSQGGLLSRAILELYPYHSVHTFISLSSPQAGQYGTQMLRVLFPHLVREEAYKLFYSRIGQYISVANYWNDPHQRELYLQYNKFLPIINNENISSAKVSRKKGIAKLKRMVLIGGPDDGVIGPWQSSHFGFYDENENVVPMRNRSFYLNDTFGLRELDEKGALKILTVSGVHHHYWHRNETVIKNYILPWLN